MRRFIPFLIGAVLAATTGMAVERAHELKKKEVQTLIMSAKTPNDHLRLAAHFEAVANKYEAEAKEHSEMADMYSKNPTASESKRPMAPDTVAHCRLIAESLDKASKEARAMAAAHEQMAKR